MSVEFRDKDKGWNRLKTEIKKAGKSYTKVGYPEEAKKSQKKYKKVSKGQKKQMTTLKVAMIQEFGAPAKNIPSRSFVRSYFDTYNWDVYEKSKKLYSKVLIGKIGTSRALGLLGEYVKSGIQKQIDNIFYPPLKPATIKAKGSSKPLISTNQLRGSVTHIEVIKGG